jgi:uncharacterized membrane protein HdeD (DUF308 family)
MIPAIAGNWWALIIRGLIALALGIVTIAWPGVTVGALVLLFGVYSFIDGVLGFVGAVKASKNHERWGYLVAEGILGVLAALVTFAWPAITAIALVYVVAAWAIITGALELAAAFRLRKYITGELLLALAGVISILFGIMLIASPIAGALVIATWIGVYELIFGVMLLFLGVRLRGWSRRALGPAAVSVPS